MDPVDVFLDTNVFYMAKFAFRESCLESLSKRCSDGDIRLLMNDVVLREAKSYVENDLLETARKARNVITKDRVLQSALPLAVKKSIEKQILDIPNIVGDHLDEFVQQAEMVSYSDMPVARLIDDYFNSIPPFENKKSKKDEFPDAVIAYCVRKWASEHPSTLLHFVTSDMGMKAAVSSCSNIIVHGHVIDFLDYLSSRDEIYQGICDFVTESEEVYFECVEDWLADRDWYNTVTRIDANLECEDVESLELIGLAVDDVSIEYIDDEHQRADVLIVLSAKVEFEFWYLDHSDEWHDEGDCYGTRSGLGSVDVLIPVNIQAIVRWEEVEEGDFEISIIECGSDGRGGLAFGDCQLNDSGDFPFMLT